MKFRAAVMCAAVILALGMFNMNLPDSRFTIDTGQSKMYISPETRDLPDGSYPEPMLETYQFDLQPGTYTFRLQSKTDSDGGSFELYSPLYASEDNTAGVVFAAVSIPSGSGTVTLSYRSGGIIRGARLRVVPAGEITINGITGESKGLVFTDAYAVGLLVLLFFAFAAHICGKRSLSLNHDSNGLLIFLGMIFAALVSTLPICRLSLPAAHDMTFHLARIEGVYESLLSGQLPVRMNTTFLSGYGYADQIMYPPLFLYFPAVLRLLRVSPIVSYQIFIFSINLATAGISYFAFRRLLNRRGVAVVSSFAYTLCAFRLICLFTRAAVGELLALAFLPLVLLGMYEILFMPSGGAFELTGNIYLVVGYSGIVNSHIVSLDICIMLCAIFTLVNVRRLDAYRLFAIIRAAAAFFLINIWVIHPLLSLSATNMNVMEHLYDSARDAVYPFEMFTAFNRATGLSGDLHEPRTDMPLTVGTLLGLGALLFLLDSFVLRRGKTPDKTDRLGRHMLPLAAVSLFFASTLFPWEQARLIPLAGQFLVAVQFPWRYFGAASLALCITLGIALTRTAPEKADKRLVVFACCTAVLLFAAPYIDMYMQNPGQTAVLENKQSQLNFNYIGGREYLRLNTSQEALLKRPPVVTASSGTVTISGYEKRLGVVSFKVSSADTQPLQLEVPLYYYPGYRAEAGGITAETAAGENGVLRVYLPGGEYESAQVRVFYREPVSYRVCEIISVISIICVVCERKVKRRTPPSASDRSC